METLRLLLFTDCVRNCKGCCNKDWDLDGLETENDYAKYDQIMLTGGEPMLRPLFVAKVIYEIRVQTSAPIYLYTADVRRPQVVLFLLRYLAGLTITLHEQSDVAAFKAFSLFLSDQEKRKSLRLNVFAGIDLSRANTVDWIVKRDIEWIHNCPLPENEVFCKYAAI